jgi:hypothetical protein
MRHALIRFLAALDVDAAWYVNVFPDNSFVFPFGAIHQPHVPIFFLLSPIVCHFLLTSMIVA